jgi:hypothetical protein
MPANYTLLEKITVGAAGASSATFSGIPQTGYTDLVVKYSLRNASNNTTLQVTFNNDGTRTNYSYKQFYGSGSASVLDGQSDIFWGQIDPSSYTASTFSNGEIYIPNYLSANKKSVTSDAVLENNAQAATASLLVGLWQGTAAINQISFSCYIGSFAQYSTFYLYGVSKLGTTPAIVPYATGGDTIMTDGTYWYHTFISSGTFTPQRGLTCDYLVVAGGGGGGSEDGGGGGAGGLRSTVTATGGGGSLESALSLTTTGYTVTVGAGGAGGIFNTTDATNGSNSVFSSITSTGGGRAGSEPSTGNGATGGSGGGGAGESSGPVNTGGSGTANQGFAGASGFNRTSNNEAGGGGGGAGAVGVAGAAGDGGDGGAGVATSISGSSVTYGGGGGGGVHGTTKGIGGTGGGGTGGNATDLPTAGTANTGGGGAGAGGNDARNGSAGGSGLVIVRYAV